MLARLESCFGKMEYVTYPLEVLEKIELSFDEKRAIKWMNARWHWSFYFSALYLLLIYSGRKFMKDKKPFNLRTALCMWSTGLSIFSLYAIYRVFAVARTMIHLGGFQHAFCDTNSYIGTTGGGLWAFLFPLSKLPELFDTLFIVLRKQKLSFLHYYHHVTVFIYCWFSYSTPISAGIWFGLVNYTVHGIMYCYYAVKASGRNPPRWVAKSITIIQLSQMFFGIYINYNAIISLYNNRSCQMDAFGIGISIFFYASYAVLFANFFYWSYVNKKPRSAEEVKKVASNGVPNGIPNASAVKGASTPVVLNGSPPTEVSSHYNLRKR